MALDGGGDGLGFYDRICAEARGHLTAGGVLLVEHGYDQAEPVRARFASAGFTGITLVHDLGKQPRVTWGVSAG
jgi:release factor glutamine methyltransferase